MSQSLLSHITSQQKLKDASSNFSFEQIRTVRNPAIVSNTARYLNTDWTKPEYDFAEINRFKEAETLVMQSFQKKIGLAFKEGYKFHSQDPELTDYVTRRLDEIAYMSDTTTFQLIREIYSHLDQYSNCFLVPVRKTESSGGVPYRDPKSKKMIKPIAGLFIIPPGDVEIKTDRRGHITHYRQYVANTTILKNEWPADKVIHLSWNHKSSSAVGTPRITPVLEDIRALRRIEENVELLVVQNIYPVVHYKIGTEKMPARAGEIDAAQGRILAMAADGMFITPERHEIKMIGTEGRALRVETYLDYFKKRVLAGLQLSTVDIGEGSGANRSAAETMSRVLVDAVRADQKLFEEIFFHKIIRQLLMEAGERIDFTDSAQQVHLQFNEIDYDHKIKRENHATQLWLQNGITHSEFREMMGRNPLSEEQLNNETYTALVTLKVAEESAKLQAAHAPPVASPGQVQNRNTPTNQHGSKTAPTNTTSDSILGDLQKAARKAAKDTGRITVADYKKIISTARTEAKTSLWRSVKDSWIKGYRSTGANPADTVQIGTLQDQERKLKQNLNKYVDRLFNDLDAFTKPTINKVESKVASIGYRLPFIDRTERMRAYNWGVVQGLHQLGETEYGISLEDDSHEEEVEASKRRHKISQATLSGIPPWHPNSTVKVIKAQ